MKRILGKFAVVILIVFLSAPVCAQEKTYINITPRAWLSYLDIPFEDGTSTETFFLPMYGATLTISPLMTPNFSFILTALTGNGDGDAVVLWARPPTNSGDLEIDRTDIELLVRYAVPPNRNLLVYCGGRYITFDRTLKVPYWSYRAETEATLWAAEIGLGATVDMTENARHKFFGNFTFGFVFQDWKFDDSDGVAASGDNTAPMIDLNAGYQYTYKSLSFSCRYRLFTYSNRTEIFEGDDQDKLATIHGLEVGFTLTF